MGMSVNKRSGSKMTAELPERQPHQLGGHIRPDDLYKFPLSPQQLLAGLVPKDHDRGPAQLQ